MVWVPAPARGQTRIGTVDRLTNDFFALAKPSLTGLLRQGGTRRLAWGMRYRRPENAGPRDRLERVLSDRVRGQLATLPDPEEVPAPPGAERVDLREGARAVGADLLLVIDVYERRNHLHMVGELFDVRTTFWSRIRRPIVGMRSHFYATARIDAEIRALMSVDTAQGPRRFELIRPPDGTPSGEPWLAVAVADVDGDGLNEVALLGAKTLAIARIAGRRARPIASLPLGDLPRATQPTRERFGALVAADLNGDRRAELGLWTSDLERGHVVRFRGGRVEPCRWAARAKVCGATHPAGSPMRLCGPPLAVVPPHGESDTEPTLLVGEVPSGLNHLQGKITRWTWSGGELAVARTEHLYWSLSGRPLKLPERGAYHDLMVTVDRQNTLRVRGGGTTWRVREAGVAAITVDLNDDGEAELVRTAASWPDERDRLSLHRLTPEGRTPLLWRQEMPAIASLASGDIDNDGYGEVLVLSGGGRLHLVRELR